MNISRELELTSPKVIKEILARHGFNFSKSLGQNFLINPSVCPKMADICGAGEDIAVIEVGPGIGVLTKELALKGGEVFSVELDKKLLPILEETLGNFENVKIINDDILKLDIKALIENQVNSGRVAVCANLPYYITSPIIMMLLESCLSECKVPLDNITVMVQKEAALRLCAKPGTRESGAVTLAVWYYSEPSLAFNVSRGSFVPAPNVDSAVIRLKVRQTPPVDVKDEKFMFRLIRFGFNKRRKTLTNSLQGADENIDKPKLLSALNKSGISPTARAEELTLEDWASLSNELYTD